ncbi:MAG: valine--tRNA ligase [Candidatus Magasanikbacteria bacterium]|nr:valine--tRNA ligase [Candidatus Magasanikbacteria bacterium]
MLIVHKIAVNMKELEKAYEAKKYEDGIYEKWEESGLFNPDVCVEKSTAKKDAPIFSMVLPPPNVTGVLHMGHAAMLAIEDAMIRYHRMKGDRTLWLPGTDHAAIATQTKVEKLLMEKGVKDPRVELGREKFLEEVDKFAKASHDTIINQCKKMGSSLDWSREAFTLDEKRNLAVRTVFKKMYDDGLIERGYRIVNWCPRCHSTLADDEVEYKEQSAKIYIFKYSADFPFAIATTRPETKLGDTAVAVNPKDKRYKKFIGKTFKVKSFAGGADLNIEVIGDEAVDMNFGTGALGVTPAHSHVDYEMAQKNNLPVIKVIDEDGNMAADAGTVYAGLSVKDARKKVVENLRVSNLLEKEEDAPNNLSVCYRCETPIEPLPSKQWFIKVNKEFQMGPSKIMGIKEGQKTTLKKLMQAAVREGQIKIIPDRFDKTYFHWIDNLHDWCISRQIWYGHRIPVWYKGDQTYVGFEAPKDSGWQQDSDTLDTWFSSGLWTFSTLGWPDKTDDFNNYHPTSVLETGYDILPFWVARMILMTTYTLGDIPFETVYLHGLVRDEQGRKMSKSLGNVIDPLAMVEKFGADATRLSLMLGNTPGNDSRLSEEKIAGFRNFTNKLWNICRYMMMQIDFEKSEPAKPVTLADFWILERLHEIASDTSKHIEQFNFSFAGEKLRDFTWNELADWYLEISKIEGNKSGILQYILETILKLWHPFMPFVTEAIWSEIPGKKLLMAEKWPQLKKEKISGRVKDFEIIKNIITNIRSLRAEYKVEPAKKISVSIGAGKFAGLLKDNVEILQGLARIEKIQIDKSMKKPGNSVGFLESGVEVFIDLSGLVDFAKEKIRLQKEIGEVEPYIAVLKKKLSNKEFVKNAPKEIVANENAKLAEAEEMLAKLNDQLKSI